tara:strand:+ start:294 stop:509 length:216 start_codon:yes stop_codon:yes gene_type:complete
MDYQIGEYEFKTSGPNGNPISVFWGNDAFWLNWPSLKQAGYLTADYGNASNYGHITLYPTDKAQEFIVTNK